ncbi:MAG TPA: hypothetical protein VG722_09980, partial [Tepidisphaeraceae bacterium]|nr:hypothetical protein [Tepidisphaeraceae bacterium]
SLPETLDSRELRTLFSELLAVPINSASDAVVAARALRELSDRQWHNYERIASDLADGITDWIISQWTPYSPEFVVNATSVVAMLGLPRALPVIEESLSKPLAPELRDRLAKFIEHVKHTINDPYAGMRQG